MALTTAQKLVIALGLLALLAGLFILSLMHTPRGSDPLELITHDPGPSDTIIVHVVGQVKRPGVYSLPNGSRVAQAVTAAGGFTDQADTATVNLARVLDDGEQVTVGSLPPPPQPPQQPVAQAAETQPSSPQQADPAASNASASSAPVAAVPPPPRVSLNRAALAELEQVPGVGPELARRILYHRHQRGGFSRVEDLLEIRGIGPATLEQIRPHVTL